jgi:hypothetical protein
MSFTRFNYDPCRTKKLLEESTGPGRYMLNKPGWGDKPCFFSDPQIRMQEWGTNLRRVPGGAPIDINSDLLGITRPLTRDCTKKDFPFAGVVFSMKNQYPTCGKEFTAQSRATHPAFLYRDLEQSNRYPLFLNPQENVCMPFQNNLNTQLLERDNFTPKIPCPMNK